METTKIRPAGLAPITDLEREREVGDEVDFSEIELTDYEYIYYNQKPQPVRRQRTTASITLVPAGGFRFFTNVFPSLDPDAPSVEEQIDGYITAYGADNVLVREQVYDIGGQRLGNPAARAVFLRRQD